MFKEKNVSYISDVCWKLQIHQCCLCFDGVLAGWVLRSLAQFLLCNSVGIANTQGLSHGASFLRSQIDWLVFLATVQLAKILLCLLVTHDVDASDGFAYNPAEITKVN